MKAQPNPRRGIAVAALLIFCSMAAVALGVGPVSNTAASVANSAASSAAPAPRMQTA